MSEKSKVPRPTKLQNKLVKRAKHTAKEEAFLVGDPRIKNEGSSSDVEVSESLSSSSEQEQSQTSLEHTDEDFEMGPLTPTRAKQHFRTHFDLINERIE